MTDRQSSLAPGDVVADTYEVERLIGRGGMGEVWQARHRRVAGKQVAIKVLLLDRQASTDTLARFKREAEIAARLEHPNIVQVTDFSTLPSGHAYLVMELLKGQSLAARAQAGRLPLEQLFAVMRQVGSALQAAHRAGVVHRDLKPDNVFLVPTALGDQVKVLDFGISKQAESQTVKTTDSMLVGTPLYMSPEQALGHNSEVSPQSDLFSLGSICFELLTGQAPFWADNVAKVMFRIAYEPAPSLAALRPDLPAHVVHAVMHALEKDRAKRTASIEDFVAELTGQPLQAVAQPAPSAGGLLAPGMAATPSMDSGATRAPSRPLATPAVGPAAPPLEDPAALAATAARSGPVSPSAPPVTAALEAPVRTVSGRAFIVTLLVAVVAIAAVVTKVRLDNWALRAAYRAGLVDAGVMRPDGTLIDAGAPVDAGASQTGGEPALDAGGGPGDAGATPAVAPRPTLTPAPRLSDAEAAYLEKLRALQAAELWAKLLDLKNQMRLRLTSPAAKAAGLRLVVEAACAERANVELSGLVRELRATDTRDAVLATRERCLKYFPEAKALDW